MTREINNNEEEKRRRVKMNKKEDNEKNKENQGVINYSGRGLHTVHSKERREGA